MTIEARNDRTGVVVITDAVGKRHVLGVHTLGKAVATGPRTSYITIPGGNIFVNCSIAEVRKALRRARSPQLELDFEKETAAQLSTETAAQLAQTVEEGVANGRS